ncbi:hypothetical protein DITRI_Ditri04bG0174800 [Diplodiscus trichospermus]
MHLESSAILITETSDDSSERSDQETPLLSNKKYRVRAALWVESSKSQGKENFTKRWKKTMCKPCVYLVTLGMPLSFLTGIVSAFNFLLRNVCNRGWLQQEWNPSTISIWDLFFAWSTLAASACAISATHEKKAWHILAWVSSVAGNLSVLRSTADLICVRALRENSYHGT